jgi:ubiquitin C-terminal hydrolase
MVKILIDSLDGPLGELAYDILVLLPREFFETRFSPCKAWLARSIFAIRLSYFDLLLAKSFDNVVDTMRDVFMFARDFDANEHLTTELAGVCCEIIVLISKKSRFGSTKKQVLELLLHWAQFPSCFEKISRCFAAFFATNRDPKLKLPQPHSHLALLLDTDKNSRKLAEIICKNVTIPLDCFGSILERESTEELLICIRSCVIHSCSTDGVQSLAEHLYNLAKISHSCMLQRCLEIFLVIVEKKLLPACSLLDKVSECLVDKFLTSPLDPNDIVAFPTAAMFLANQAAENDFLCPVLDRLHQKRIPFDSCGIDSEDCHRPAIGKVGLKNLGNTCYLNAVLQQLFAIEPFRNLILGLEPQTAFFCEFSVLFWLMLESNSRFVSTENFVAQYFLYGVALNCHQQQDAVEILQDLLCRFENTELVPSLFAGTLRHTIHGESSQRSVVENFITLDLEVDHQNSLTDSFDFLVRTEALIGGDKYQSEDGTRMDAMKTIMIETSPPILILHLKRFKYEARQQTRLKIDDLFRISATLDLSPYSTTADLVYTLRGVIVHSGNALSGHYISFVRDSSNWLRFDDTEVTRISESELFKIAEGGQEGGGSAYVLFYERVHNMSCEKPAIEIPALRHHNNMMDAKRLFCSSGYFTLMFSLENQSSMRYHKFAMQYIVDSLMFSSLTDRVDVFLSLVRSKVALMPRELCTNFLAYFVGFLPSFLFKCREPLLRTGIVKLLKTTISADSDSSDPIRRLLRSSTGWRKTGIRSTRTLRSSTSASRGEVQPSQGIWARGLSCCFRACSRFLFTPILHTS